MCPIYLLCFAGAARSLFFMTCGVPALTRSKPCEKHARFYFSLFSMVYVYISRARRAYGCLRAASVLSCGGRICRVFFAARPISDTGCILRKL
jgi:hypothetical protein